MTSALKGSIASLITSDHTSLQQHLQLPYYRRRYCISHTPDSTWVENEIICGCAHTCLHMRKGVFLESNLQTTDSSNMLSCSLCSSDYFVISNKYASGKCIRVKVYILIRKCRGVKVKVGWNIKTQVKYRYSPKILKYCNKVLLLRYITPLVCFKQNPSFFYQFANNCMQMWNDRVERTTKRNNFCNGWLWL